MLSFLIAFCAFAICVFCFFREIDSDHKRYLEQDRLGDEHIAREIEKFLREKDLEHPGIGGPK